MSDAGPPSDAALPCLTISPTPTETELAAIVAALATCLIERVEDRIAGPLTSRWAAVGRREAMRPM
ncbi:MAG: hypothetical protein H0V37_09290, partial [Chloroflexia bacterium]|nr:hypothetical protein [Chloroflexia bacterium]